MSNTWISGMFMYLRNRKSHKLCAVTFTSHDWANKWNAKFSLQIQKYKCVKLSFFLLGFPNLPYSTLNRPIVRLLQWSNWSRSRQLNQGRPYRSILKFGKSRVFIKTIYHFILWLISIYKSLSLEKPPNAYLLWKAFVQNVNFLMPKTD